MTNTVPPEGSARPTTLSLDTDRIIGTISTLRQRIAERFPDSGLKLLAASLLAIAEQTKDHLDEIERPVLWLRTATWLMAALVVAGFAAAVRAVVVAIPDGFGNALDAVQLFESGIQDVVFIGFGLVLCWLVELYGYGLDPEVYFIERLPVEISGVASADLFLLVIRQFAHQAAI